MMHIFTPYFSAEEEYVVDGCRILHDELIVFDGEGMIVASRVGDPILREAKSFFSLLGAEELRFFRDCPWGTGKKPVLLLTSVGAALVFGHLFSASGLFAAVIFHDTAVRGVFENGYFGDIMISDGVKGETFEKDVVETADCAMSALCFSGDESPASLALRACAIARLVGCHLVCRAQGISGVSDLFLFHVNAYIALILCLLLRARDAAQDRSATIHICERDGRIFIDFAMQAEIFEPFPFLEALCEKKEFPFAITYENGLETVSFSPEICDVSLLGLKNRFLFN